MREQCLFNCRCSASESEANRYGLLGETHCCEGSSGCYAPAHRPEIREVLSTIEGLDFPDFLNKVPIPFLPESISTIPGDSPLPFGTGPLGPVIATRYTQIGGLRQKPMDRERVSGWRRFRGIPQHRRVLLVQESKDNVLEELFPVTLRPDFFTTIALLGDIVLVSPGYSVYDNGTMCEWLQLVNLKRSIHFAYLANLAGLPCIPCIGWHKDRKKDLERLVEWLIRQGDKITHLAVNAQTGGFSLWTSLVEGMSYIEQMTGRTYQWVIFGGTEPLRVVYGQFPACRVVQVSAAVSTYTLKHRLLGERETNDLRPEELLLQNIARQNIRRNLAEIIAGASKEGSDIVQGIYYRPSARSQVQPQQRTK